MRALVVDSDPVFAALVEDRLALTGHQLEVASDREEALQRTAAGGIDLILLEAPSEDDAPRRLVDALRRQPASSEVPILVIADQDDRHARLAILRAGADDYVTRPCDLEEITLRAERLVSGRDSAQVALEGDLARHPVADVVQYLASAAKSGRLEVQSSTGAAYMELAHGKAVAAEAGGLRGDEALLALASLHKGRFRFVSTPPSAAPPAEAVSISQLLMEAAWLEDELSKRGEHLPPTGAPLTVCGLLPDPDEALGDLPLSAVYERIRKRSGIRIFDLLNEAPPAAPVRVRLAVAVLVEAKAVEIADSIASGPYPTTTELSTAAVIQVAIHQLLTAAREGGVVGSVVPYLLLADPGVWDKLTELFAAVPPDPAGGGLHEMAASLAAGQGASTTVDTDAGRLGLHVQRLVTPVPSQFEAIAAVCAGILLWVDDPAVLPQLRALMRRLSESRTPVVGVLVASNPAVLPLARALTTETPAWRLTTTPPRSLLGLLRLLRLQPNKARAEA